MRLPNYIVRQLGHPTGFLGRILLGRLNSANRKMNAIAFKSLDVEAADRVLEIGFGGGALLESIIASGPSRIAGVEISEIAVRRMRKRQRRWVCNGTLELVRTEGTSIPFSQHSFTKICCVNVVYFWGDPSLVVSEVHRVLEPGGTFIICYQEIGPDDRKFPPALIEFYLDRAGFFDLTTSAQEDKQNGRYFCTSAHKPPCSTEMN